jgi:hypothetical protein
VPPHRFKATTPERPLPLDLGRETRILDVADHPSLLDLHNNENCGLKRGNVTVKRTLFFVVVIAVAALEGFYLGPLGFDWLVGSVVITAVLAVGMRTYWHTK